MDRVSLWPKLTGSNGTEPLLAMRLCRPFCLLVSLLVTLSKGLKLLEVGAPRTGTQSIHAALEILGLKSLHSGHNQSLRIPVCKYLFGNGSLADALSVLDGYDAAMDEPFMLIYEEVMAQIPEAKFLLTISNPESWYSNYVDLVQTDGGGWWFDLIPSYLQKCFDMASWNCSFTQPSEDTKKQCLENYAAHNARVQQIIPPDRLLVFNFSDGWSSLSHFLQLQIPNVDEFPYVDEASEKIHSRAALGEAILQAVSA
ncbi:unnamed protein product [Durusdinium trenchii]|uniref:Uncharacterized protein n=2 Tax=Durusdinium trenchii TaxID=1381693 RepID=A0ABP0SPL5_9DINO